ncbi:MAG: hypothetical protein IT335_13020 [Thermomicrobiales bacterium]|nr:hypothetical protein [Thermomicrobiales bacterium]
MEPRPFGRRPRAVADALISQAQALTIKNGIWDLHQTVTQMTDQLERVIATQADHDRALTHLDNDVHALKTASATGPARPGLSGPPRMQLIGEATAPDMAARGEAWEQMIAGLTVYIGQGVTGDELWGVLDQAVIEVEIRTGFDAGVQP